jgi:ketosteroid isomerase-like protein
VSTPAEIARELIARINSHDVEALAALLTPDHRFVDSLGTVVEGRETLRAGWRQYLAMVPDYRIDVEVLLSEGPLVLLAGTAGGTYVRGGTLEARNAWSTPAAFRAVIRGGQVAQWQVYADNEPLRRCMAQ